MSSTVWGKEIMTPLEVINKSKGKFISVKFKSRRTGELRNMNCRTGVRKELKGVGMGYDAAEKGLVTVWDVQKNDYRSIPLEGVIEINSEGVRWLYV